MKLKHFSGTGTIYRSARLTRTLLGIGIAAMFSLTCYRFSQLREGADAAQTRSTLAGMIGADGTYSVGYNHGQILSIDGKEIAVDYETTSGWSKFCGVPGYNGVLGSSGSGGAITEWHDVLYSSSDPINREMRCGNTVQTTLSSSGQETAAALLASLCPDTICDSAALAVVLRDGAVLVAAGNNYCTPEDYFNDARIQEVHENYAVQPYQIGSTAKVPMARVLLLHDGMLSPEWSLYNPEFCDVDRVVIPGGAFIHNYDFQMANAYIAVTEDGVRWRWVNLADALAHSSNTYFLRHMLQLGGARSAYRLVGETYGLFSPMETEICTLDAVSCDDNRLYYFFWGQDFRTSVCRLCEIYNHALGSEAYPCFFCSAVYLPDNTEIYRADPQPSASLSFGTGADDILKDGLAGCFTSYGIDPQLTQPYQSLIDEGRLLTKSGTADTVETKGLTNSVRVLTVLDENREVTATAALLVHNLQPGSLGTQKMYRILLETLDAAGVIAPDNG